MKLKANLLKLKNIKNINEKNKLMKIKHLLNTDYKIWINSFCNNLKNIFQCLKL